MKKLLAIFLALLTANLYAAPPVNPNTCFNKYPWATTYPGKYWPEVDKEAKICKQLFYTATDRGNIIGIYSRPFTTVNMELQCGSYTAIGYRAEGPPQSSNVVQLLLGDAAGITSTNTWYDQQFYYPKTPNVGNDILAGLYYPSVSKKFCYEIDNTIVALCHYYVPAGIYATLDTFLANSVSGGEPIQEIPYYGDIGCIIWDLGEPWKSACNVVVGTWWDDAQTLPKTTSWYIPTEYAFPYPSGSDMSHNDGSVGVFTLKAADLRAAMISQLKYGISDGVPCADNLHYNFLMYSGGGWDSFVDPQCYSEIGVWGDFGGPGDPIMMAYLGTSIDTGWADGLTQYTMGEAGRKDWREELSITGDMATDQQPYDWPDSGWSGAFSYHTYSEMSLDGSIEPGDTLIFNGMDKGRESGDPSTQWDPNGFLMDLGGTEHAYNQNPPVSWSGHSPVNISFSWSGEGVFLDGEWIPEEPAGYYDETTSTDVVTNAPATTNIIYRFAYLNAWTNTPAGIDLEDVVCHFYISGSYYETTNKNCSSINTYTNMIERFYSMYRTNLTDITFTTQHVETTISVWHDAVPAYYRSWWSAYFPNHFYTTSGLWEFYKDGDLVNYVESQMIAYDVRPNLDFVVKNSPDFFQARIYGLGWKISERPSSGVLAYGEYNDSCTYIKPDIANGEELEEGKIKYLGNGTMSDEDLNMIYWNSSNAMYGNKTYSEKADVESRCFYGIRQAWYILLYTFPKRDGSLPDPM